MLRSNAMAVKIKQLLWPIIENGSKAGMTLIVVQNQYSIINFNCSGIPFQSTILATTTTTL